MKLSQATPRKRLHSLVYGPPKSGKTELVGELASQGYNLIFVDFENGSNTLFHSVPREFHDNIELIKIPDTKDVPIGIETALKIVKVGKHKICDFHGKRECPVCNKDPKATHSTIDLTTMGDKDILVFDSLTQISNSALAHIGLGKDDTWKPDWDDWGRQGNILDRFLGHIQNAPFHVIVISHEILVETNDAKEKIVPVAGTRNFSRNSAKYFDEVVYCQVRNKRHEAASSSTYDLNILTGSRSRVRVEDQKDPTKHLSLLPIFENAENIVTAADNAKNLLTDMKTKIEEKK